MKTQKSGIEILRAAVALFDNTNESFMVPDHDTAPTADDLLHIYEAYAASGWDLTPDQWSSRQVTEALTLRLVPAWDEKTQAPLYGEAAELARQRMAARREK